MSDTAAPAPTAPVGVSALDPSAIPADPMEARAAITAAIADPEFRKTLLSGNQAARARWDALHKNGFPNLEGDAASIAAQAARRESGQRETFLAHIADLANLTSTQVDEIRMRKPCTPEEHTWATREVARMKADPATRAKILARDPDAMTAWIKAVQLAALPVQPAK